MILFFYLDNSMFANNTAAIYGGVMFICESLFHIIDSILANNSATGGGVAHAISLEREH